MWRPVLLLTAVFSAADLLPTASFAQPIADEPDTWEQALTAPPAPDFEVAAARRDRGIRLADFLPGNMLLRAILGSSSDRPSQSEFAMDEETAAPARSTPGALEDELQYDPPLPTEPALPVELPIASPAPPVAMDEVAQHEPTSEPMEAEPMPHGPLSTLAPSPDPFFGAVHKLLSAGDYQPLFPRHTIRPPAAPRLVDGEPMLIVATGATVSMSELPAIANADLLIITTERSAAESPGKVALLVDGRALLLEVVDWQTGTVKAQMPAISLRQPTPARLYLSNASGLILDGIDFVLLPAEAE